MTKDGEKPDSLRNRLANRIDHLVDLIESIDPAWINAELGVRAALSAMSSWLMVRWSLDLLDVAYSPATELYAVIVSVLCYLIVVERRPEPRLRLTAACLIPAMIAPAFVPLLGDSTALIWLALLAFMFLSYAVRPRSATAGTLLVFGVMCLNFVSVAHVDFQRLLRFELAAFIGVLVAMFWQFAIRPRTELDFLVRATDSLLESGRLCGNSIETRLATGALESQIRIGLRLRRLAAARKALNEPLGEFEASARGQTPLAAKLRLSVNAFERGVRLMSEAEQRLVSDDVDVPPDLTSQLISALSTWSASLRARKTTTAASDSAKTPWDALRKLIDVSGDAPWRDSILQLVVGGTQAAVAGQDIEQVRQQILAASSVTHTPEETRTAPAPKPAAAPPPRRLHPATIMGIQAALATGLAMLTAITLGLSNPNWAFLAAFAVVAGSAGQSIRRIGWRIGGTLAGGTIGVLVSWLVPESGPWSPVLISFCVFLVIAFRAWSYIWMVASLTAALALGYTAFGGSGTDLLLDRTLDTIVGAVIGGLVVSFVFPIHLRDRYTQTVGTYITAVNGYLDASLQELRGTTPPVSSQTLEMKAAAAYDAIEAAIPAMTLEFNPMSHTRAILATHQSALASIDDGVERFSSSLAELGTMGASPRVIAVLSDIVGRIHLRIASIDWGLDDTKSDQTAAPSPKGPFVTNDTDAMPTEANEETGPGQRLLSAAVTILLAVSEIEPDGGGKANSPSSEPQSTVGSQISH